MSQVSSSPWQFSEISECQTTHFSRVAQKETICSRMKSFSFVLQTWPIDCKIFRASIHTAKYINAHANSRDSRSKQGIGKIIDDDC